VSLCLLFGCLAYISILVILLIFSYGMYFLIVVFITCVCYLYVNYIFIIYALLLFYRCKLYCTALFYSCIMSVIFVMSFKLVWCFDFDLLLIELLVHRWWICEKYICVCKCVCVSVAQTNSMRTVYLCYYKVHISGSVSWPNCNKKINRW
jgi:hypothetical protein